MKKILIILVVMGLGGCAGGHGAKSTVNNWYRSDRDRWQTAIEMKDCAKRASPGFPAGMIIDDHIFDECMTQKNFEWRPR